MRGVLLLLALLAHSFAAEESCMDRCESGFDSRKGCQCDSMCKYYKSCCSDFEVMCGMMTRGDTFSFPEDDDGNEGSTTVSPAQSSAVPARRPFPDFRPPQRPDTLDMTRPPRLRDAIFQRRPTPASDRLLPLHTDPTAITDPPRTTANTGRPNVTTGRPPTTVMPTTVMPTTAPATTPGTTEAPDPDAEVCSGRAFDSFMQLKNGSIYAFRGNYVFELGQKSVLPGFPKRIKDMWGIDGPIDAAFTRVNCRGKTYMFKGNQYWRFDDGVLDEDYPRDISVGFDKIPDHVDAAFSLPASGHHGRERVYFFKGDQYYQYEFLHQPSHEECISMSASSPSVLFRQYTDVYYNAYESYFSRLFSDLPEHHSSHHFIDRDWKGLRAPVDAAMAGRIYMSPWRPSRRYGYGQDQDWYRGRGGQWGRRRQSRSPWGAEQGMSMGQDMATRGMEMGMRLAEKRMEMEERMGRSWDRGWGGEREWEWEWDDQWDQDQRRDRYGYYDSRYDRPYYGSRRSMPIQSVYFFKGAKYYRVDLRSKRVDPAVPPYPRSIAQYWLGCTKTTGAEK